MINRFLIAFFAVLLFGISSANTLTTPSVEKEELRSSLVQNEDETSGEEKEELNISLSYEAVFQVFHFFPKTWQSGILAFVSFENFQGVSHEFLIRDFLVPRNLTLFRQIISRNAP